MNYHGICYINNTNYGIMPICTIDNSFYAPNEAMHLFNSC